MGVSRHSTEVKKQVTTILWGKKVIRKVRTVEDLFLGAPIHFDDKKIYDMQIKEWIIELIDGDCFAYGYYKLTVTVSIRTLFAAAESTSKKRIAMFIIASYNLFPRICVNL